ncbi:Neuroguidin [Sarcoptes scabiei]|uniref:Neuroguidin n=1 Tax=Sarcoptes scabiei TaxID=52283 RepID=A0A834RDB4_SARSC|nr:Neuroguidin [Sarcoptes scabiei]
MNKMNEDKDLETKINDLLREFNENLVHCVISVKNLSNRFRNNELDIKSGVKLLDLKNEIFLSYLIDIVDVMKKKMLSVDFSSTVERLVEQRVVLEKVKSIEDKFRYQMDLLTKSSSSNNFNAKNPMDLKPNLLLSLNETSIDDDLNDKNISATEKANLDNQIDEKKKKPSMKDDASKNQKYVPPRLAQLKYEDDQERKSRELQRMKRRAINSSLINELRRELDDGPEEEHDLLLNKKSGVEKFLKRKTAYEESNFIRLSLNRKQKSEVKRYSTVNTIGNDITRFEDISVLEMKDSDEYRPPPKKSKKFKNSRASSKRKIKFKKRR